MPVVGLLSTVFKYELFISAANWNADVDLRRTRRRIFGNVSTDGTVEQMVRQLTRLNRFR